MLTLAERLRSLVLPMVVLCALSAGDAWALRSPSPTATPSKTPTSTPTASKTPTASPTLTPTATRTPTITPTRTPTTTPTDTPTKTKTPTMTPVPTSTGTPYTATPTPTYTQTDTPTTTPSKTPTPTDTPSPTNTPTPTDTPTSTLTPTALPTSTSTPCFFFAKDFPPVFPVNTPHIIPPKSAAESDARVFETYLVPSQSKYKYDVCLTFTGSVNFAWQVGTECLYTVYGSDGYTTHSSPFKFGMMDVNAGAIYVYLSSLSVPSKQISAIPHLYLITPTPTATP